MEIVVKDTAEAFAAEGASIFARLCKEAIASRGRFAVALTGGSTPGPIHRLLSQEPHRSSIDWPRVEVFFGDERAVPPERKESNYGAARDQLLAHVPLDPAKVHRMQGEHADLAQAAKDYAATFLSVCSGALDLLMIGIGKDAHILSLYPGSLAIDEEQEIVVAEIDPPMNPALSRITMTPLAIAKARHVLAIASGEEKSRAVRIALTGQDDRHSYPAQLLRRVSDRTTWLLDALAHQELDPPTDPGPPETNPGT